VQALLERAGGRLTAADTHQIALTFTDAAEAADFLIRLDYLVAAAERE
jgi:hypothetical protein